jgi:hypothetical protein
MDEDGCCSRKWWRGIFTKLGRCPACLRLSLGLAVGAWILTLPVYRLSLSTGLLRLVTTVAAAFTLLTGTHLVARLVRYLSAGLERGRQDERLWSVYRVIVGVDHCGIREGMIACVLCRGVPGLPCGRVGSRRQCFVPMGPNGTLCQARIEIELLERFCRECSPGDLRATVLFTD